MSDVINYYKEYLDLKKHFNSNRFVYGRDSAPFLIKWNREPEGRKEWWRTLRLAETLTNFRKRLIANFLIEPRTYYLHLKKLDSNVVKEFETYWSNHLYYFKNDLEIINGEFEKVWLLEEDKKIRIETIMFLQKLGVISTPTFIIKKYIVMMEPKLDWDKIKEVYVNSFKEK